MGVSGASHAGSRSIELPLGGGDYTQALYAGYELGPESADDFNSDYLPPRIIGQVRPDSPAERAGLRRGDRILMVQGVPFEDQERIIKLGRPKVGGIRSLVVERHGEQLPINITYAKKPESYNFRYTAFAIIAFAFLATGTICFWFYPASATNLLFWLGFTGAFAFMHKPYFISFATRSAFACFGGLSLRCGWPFYSIPAGLSQTQTGVSDRLWLAWVVYLPSLLLFFVIAYYAVFPSGLTDRGGLIINMAFLFIGVYLVVGVAAFIQTYLTLPRSERTRGIKMMAIGTATGILPIALSIIAVILVPQIRLLGRDYYIILTLVLIPLSFGYAIWEQMRDAGGKTAAA